MKQSILATLAGTLLLACGLSSAHQTYLISDLYELRPGTDNFLILKNGTYHESGYSITRKMSRDISIVMGGQRKTPPDNEVSTSIRTRHTKCFLHQGRCRQETELAGVAAHPTICVARGNLLNYLT
jgi:hypothetical protein